jgi:hypothetical protein
MCSPGASFNRGILGDDFEDHGPTSGSSFFGTVPYERRGSGGEEEEDPPACNAARFGDRRQEVCPHFLR